MPAAMCVSGTLQLRALTSLLQLLLAIPAASAVAKVSQGSAAGFTFRLSGFLFLKLHLY